MKSKFEIWKTIKISTYKNIDELRNAFKESGFGINTDVNFLLGGECTFLGGPVFIRESPFISGEERKIQLVNVSMADLGFKNGARYGVICSRARELGLELCPNEVGPQLRLQYKNQPAGNLLHVAIEPIKDFFGIRTIFELWHHGGHMWINMVSSEFSFSSYFCNEDTRFVFYLP